MLLTVNYSARFRSFSPARKAVEVAFAPSVLVPPAALAWAVWTAAVSSDVGILAATAVFIALAAVWLAKLSAAPVYQAAAK